MIVLNLDWMWYVVEPHYLHTNVNLLDKSHWQFRDYSLLVYLLLSLLANSYVHII